MRNLTEKLDLSTTLSDGSIFWRDTILPKYNTHPRYQDIPIIDGCGVNILIDSFADLSEDKKYLSLWREDVVIRSDESSRNLPNLVAGLNFSFKIISDKSRVILLEVFSNDPADTSKDATYIVKRVNIYRPF